MHLCLNLIVKNESKNMLRCLESFNKIKYRNEKGQLEEAVKAIAITDTGSTDDTMKIVQEWIKKNKKLGGIQSKPWEGPAFHFAINRNLSLEYAYKVIEENKKPSETWYILFTDADNLIHPMIKDEEIILPGGLDKDKYYCDFRTGNSHFSGNLMVKYQPEKGWCWIGGVHEYLTHKDASVSSDKVNTLWMDARCEGFRSQNDLKYVRDVKYLRELIAEAKKYKERKVKGVYEEEEAASLVRYHFYLAQSLRDSAFGMEKQSEEAYLKRAEMGDWAQEVYVSYVEAFKQRLLRKGKMDMKGASYLEKAINTDPERLEAPHYYIKYLNSEKRFNQAWMLAKGLLKCEKKDGKLFMESHIYDHAFLDEAGVSAFYAGNKVMAKLLFEKVLPKVHESQRERLLNNIKHCS
ncbi:Glycosyltransferase family 2 [Cedratvirus A11]|uniref:Glycosyltransferase family 2 n=1 Tax=Cedratvirus A11 TaxID=1903266 RepID=A0A1M7XTX7_9VIRU|nr:beta-1,4-glycosyltransferase [Cedratvirus A11]SHO33129.1 Glycosyltransferase family 2 [Cedratvirus A11]